MHPILRDRRWLGLHLVVWLVAAAMISLLVRGLVGASWLASVGVGMPMGLVGGLVTLSAWWVATRHTLPGNGPAPLAGDILPRVDRVRRDLGVSRPALVAGSRAGRRRRAPGPSAAGPRRDAPGHWGGGVSVGPGGLPRGAGVRGNDGRDRSCAAVGGRATGRGVTRASSPVGSALSVQQPQLDSRLDRHRPGRARAMCQLLARVSARRACTSADGRRFRSPRGRARRAVPGHRAGAFRLAAHGGAARRARAAGCPVPPLLLQPLVENAVRHGIATLLEGGTIAIETRRVGDRVRRDRVESARSDGRGRGTGLGLDIVRRRLAATFGDGATLTWSRRADVFRAPGHVPVEEV